MTTTTIDAPVAPAQPEPAPDPYQAMDADQLLLLLKAAVAAIPTLQSEVEKQSGLAELAFQRSENAAAIQQAWDARRIAQERLAGETERRRVLEGKLAGFSEAEVGAINAELRTRAEAVAQRRLALVEKVYSSIAGVQSVLSELDECSKTLNRFASDSEAR